VTPTHSCRYRHRFAKACHNSITIHFSTICTSNGAPSHTNMREIPDLQVICLRAVGSHQSSAEATFTQGENGELSLASRLLRSFHLRDSKIRNEESGSSSLLSIQSVPIPPRPCIGPGSSRRINANEVDMNHPFIGCRETSSASNVPSRVLLIQFGNPALDYLQSYIDTLVDLGRMDDRRLGIHFFREWKTNVLLANRTASSSLTVSSASKATTKKRRRSEVESYAITDAMTNSLPLGSLSLYNCTIADETIESMITSGMCPHLAVLDLTGLRGLTDDLAIQIFRAAPNIQRLSLKNCRKITGKSVVQLISIKMLQCLDVGGCFNISSSDIVDIIPSLPELSELHASGLLWNDASLQALVSCRDTWKGLSLGFSNDLSQHVLRECLLQLGDSLQSLALPFCESVVDNALLGVLGRNMPMLQYLDLRGNSSLNTITGFYDGRTSADLPAQALTVIGRYSGLSDASIEETRRIHPLHAASNFLTVCLDEKGMGAAITRTNLNM
jgi:hypothetical protein